MVRFPALSRAACPNSTKLNKIAANLVNYRTKKLNPFQVLSPQAYQPELLDGLDGRKEGMKEGMNE